MKSRTKILRNSYINFSAAALLAGFVLPTGAVSFAQADPLERGIQGAVGGAIIGGIIDGGKGAGRGAAIGGAIGIIAGAAEEERYRRGYEDDEDYEYRRNDETIDDILDQQAESGN